ncbi:hypothetical protein OQA88_2322 [Cercophora sp. LCS_1]
MASPTRVSLKSFLTTARKALTAPATHRPNPLTFVIGNESADLDSLCSAVLLAYFRTHTPPNTLHIPLSNLPRSDLALHPELNAVLRPAGLTPDDLLTLTDLPTSGLAPDQTRWLLVDHNVPTGLFHSQFTSSSTSGNLLIGCIDHHGDEAVIPSSSETRVFAKCGSCASLVVSHYRSAWDSLVSDKNIDAEVAHLALGPILIDTTNLESKEKTAELDVEATKFAEGKIAESLGYQRKGYHDEIQRLKEDISGLGYRDVLRKDYKMWRDGGLNLGMSIVVQGFGYLTTETGDPEGFLGALREWREGQGLDVLAVMTVSNPEGRFTRELLMWAFGEDATEVVKQFVRRNGEDLGLESWRRGEMDEERDGEWRACWTQKGLKYSRKQVGPMLREVMRDVSKL